MAASIFDHPGYLLLIVFIALVRWLASKAKSQTQTPEARPPPAAANRPIPRGGSAETEEERIRRFLEALGQPPGTTPPKIAPRRREVQPKIFPRLPPLTTAPPPLPQPSATPPPMPMEMGSVASSATAQLPAFEVQDLVRQASSEPAPETRRPVSARSDLRLKLGTTQDLRKAIILREIFGPPRSLQTVDLTSGF